MMEIRRVEESVLELFNDGYVRGSTHLAIGQEAVAVGLAAAARPTDMVACTYRGHGTALALGLPPEAVIGEICGRQVGCTDGLGGSMHLVEPDVGLLPTFAIVGAGIPVATGAALTAWVRGTDDAAVAVFGDGTANIGAFHESLNMAATMKLPVVFLCENNLYGEYSRIDRTTPVADIADRAAAYAMPGVVVDGQDVDAVTAAIGEALARARAGEGPTLVEAKTYRYSGHSRTDAGAYRPDGELDQWKQRDPIELGTARLLESGIATQEDVAALEASVAERVQAAVDIVLASPHPDETEILRHVLAPANR
ncbi:MAG: thiamine pyrophosphate-dependent dehydrogenase E1 component subunit alpha [Actinobacteria bacterium]|nr:thiamine pyrophosphate-dependent dehydrogenase E1 component subunit alpha [Actinomycetota bacterium]